LCAIVHPSAASTPLVALGGSVVLKSEKGEREVPAERFFVLPKDDPYHENILKPDEILISISVPNSPLAARSVYLKFREKSSMDWAMSAAAVALQVTDGTVTDCRIALGGVAPTPWRVPKAEASSWSASISAAPKSSSKSGPSKSAA